MHRTAGLLALTVCLVASSCWALYRVSNKGEWASSWPKELEVLRKQSRTLVGPNFENQHFAIRFDSQEQFEKLWPHLMSVKAKEAPVILVKGPNFFLGMEAKAGVVVHCPPASQENAPAPDKTKVHERSMYTTYIELVVDGEIIDLNRINLPTVVVDERFKEQK